MFNKISHYSKQNCISKYRNLVKGQIDFLVTIIELHGIEQPIFSSA